MQYDSTIRQSRTPDLTGQTFERWTVIQFAGYTKPCATSHKHIAVWTCQCRCGTVYDVRAINLLQSISGSCGCKARERAPQLKKAHGLVKTPEYNVWQLMRRRCTNPRDPRYSYYGARGIAICERWNDFAAFYADMGPRPTPQHTLERLRNDEGYRPDNCIWATQAVQNRNKRTNVMLTYKGVTQCATAWAREYHIQPLTFLWRIRQHWSIEEALFRPVAKSRFSRSSQSEDPTS